MSMDQPMQVDSDETSQDFWEERRKSLGFRPQNDNIYNRFLPYADQLDQEAVKYLKKIKTNLGRGILLSEQRNQWIYEIKTYISLYGCFFPKEDHILFIKIVFESIQTPGLEVSTLSSQINILLSLLRKRRLISPEDVTLEWRPLYDIYMRYLYKKNHVFQLGSSNNLESSLRQLIEISRSYFPLSATQEILDELRPLLCPLSGCKITRAVFFLELFLPTQMFPKDFDKGYKLWLDEIMKIWLEAPNSVSWQKLIFTLLSRLASDTIGYIDWSPYLPRIFTVYMQGATALSGLVPNLRNSLGSTYLAPGIASAMTFIVSMIGGPNSQALNYIQGYFKATESLYHPSNLNSFDSGHRLVLNKITCAFVDRLKREKDFRKSWFPKTPESHHITDDDIDRFVDILMPILSTALFSRFGSATVCASLRMLAWLRPEKVIPPILDKLYSAFDLVLESHRLNSLMLAVSSLAPSMIDGFGRYKEGKMHVIPLLFSCLPALDCNDVRKCVNAFSLIISLVNTVPIIDCSSIVDKRDDLTELEYNICVETSKFEEFVLLFVERVLNIVVTYTSEHQPEKIDNNPVRQGSDESLLEESMINCFLTLLYHLSPKIFESALDKLVSFLRGKLFEDKFTMKLIGNICGLYSKSHPEIALKKLVPYLTNVILRATESEDVFNEENIDGHLEFALQIMGDIMFDGPTVLNYEEEVFQVLRRCLRLKSKQAHQLASSLLLNIIDSLIEIYPRTEKNADYTFLHTWEEMSNFDKIVPVRLWGKTCNLNKLNISWYIPSGREKQFASKLVSEFLGNSLSKLDSWTEGKINLTRDELSLELKCVLQVLIPLCSSIASFDGPEHILIDTQIPLIKERIEMDTTEFLTPNGPLKRLGIALTVRKTLHHVLAHYADDTKALTTLIKIYQCLLNWFKGKNYLKLYLSNYKKLKRNYSKTISIHQRLPKCLVVRRIRYQQEARYSEKTWGHLTTHHSDLVLDLCNLATNHYSNVRSKALSALTHFKHPFGFRLIGPEIEKALLESDQDTYEKREGALNILLNYHSTATFPSLSDWRAVVPIWLALVNCPYIEKDTIVAVMTKLAQFVGPKFQPLLIEFTTSDKMREYANLLWKKGVQIDPLEHPSEEEINKGLEICRANNADNLKQYTTLVKKLAEAIESRTLHWRHEHHAFFLLKLLIREDVEFPIEGCRVIVKDGLLNDHLLTRNISVQAIAPILKKNQPKVNKHKIVINFISKNKDYDWIFYQPEIDYYDEITWQKTKFVHKTYLSCTSSKNLEVEYVTEQDATHVRNVNQVTDSEKLLLEFFKDSEKVLKLLDVISTEEKERQPFQVVMEFKNVFKGIFRNFGIDVLPSFSFYLNKIIEDSGKPEQASIDKKRVQRIAAQMIYGLLRGSKYWPLEDMLVIRDILRPLVQKLFTQVITPETLHYWTDSLGLSFIGQDGKRYSWLFVDFLNSGIFSTQGNTSNELPNGHSYESGDSTSFQQYAKLQILHILVASQCWRALPFYQSLTHTLLNNDHLYNPYQNIRSMVGALLGQACQYGGKFSQAFQALEGAPRPEDVIKFVLPKLDSGKQSSAELEKISPRPDEMYDETLFDDLKSKSLLKEKETVKLLMAVCYWMQHHLITSIHSLKPAYFDLLPIISEAINRNKDVEINKVLRVSVTLLGSCLMDDECIKAALATCVKTIKSCNSWHTKITILKFLEKLVTYNLFTLKSKSDSAELVTEIVINLIEDERVEVREQTSTVLSGLIHFNFLTVDTKFINMFATKSSIKIERQCQSGLVSNDTENLIKKHAGVLGLCSIVTAFPYEVPDFLPSVLMILVAHLHDPQPIPGTIRKCLSDFKRTHHDNWRQHKEKFDEDQLAVITDLLVSPNYYA